MPMERGQYPHLFQLDLGTQTKLNLVDRLTDLTFDKYPPVFSKIFKVSDGDSTGMTDTSVTTFGLPLQADGEYGGVHYDDIAQGFPQFYIWVTFNLGYQVSHEMMRDEQWGLAEHRARSLGRSFIWLPEVMCARLFNEGFSTTTPGAVGNLGRRNIDAKALFATDHPNPGPTGGSQANRPAGGGADLAHSSLEAMYIRMAGLKTERGMPIRNLMKRLVVPYQLGPRADEIINSSFRTDAGVNRVRNVTPKFEVIEWHYLTNARAYFGLGDQDMTNLKFAYRERPTRSMWRDEETRAVHVATFTSFDYGYSAWQGIDGDPGLGG